MPASEDADASPTDRSDTAERILDCAQERIQRCGYNAVSYGDELEDGSRAGVDNDFTQRNTTFMTWNLMHTAYQLDEAGGVPAHGNQRSKWEAGCRFDHPNPEHR